MPRAVQAVAELIAVDLFHNDNVLELTLWRSRSSVEGSLAGRGCLSALWVPGVNVRLFHVFIHIK